MRNAVGCDVRSFGRHMPRQRYQRGTLRPFVPGKAGRPERKLPRGTFWSRWYRYVKQVDGSEKRREREKIITKELAAKQHIGAEYAGPLTKTDAQRVLDLLIAQDSGTYIGPDTAVTFEQVAREYIAINQAHWGPNTARTSTNTIETHLIKKLGASKVESLEPVRLQLFLNEYVGAGACQSLLDKLKLYLRSILDLAVVKDIIKANPARNPSFRLPAQSRKKQSDCSLSAEQSRRLLSVVVGVDHLIFRMFIQLGLRPEELLALRPNDVIGNKLRIDEAIVERIATRVKTEASCDSVFIPPGLAMELCMWMECSKADSDAWLFPAARGGCWDHHNYLNRVLKPAGVRAKILLRSTGRKTSSGEPAYASDLNFQILRRTSATLFGDRAKDPKLTQAHLRHADPQVSLGHYQQAIPESLKAAAMAMEADLFEGELRGRRKDDIQ